MQTEIAQVTKFCHSKEAVSFPSRSQAINWLFKHLAFRHFVFDVILFMTDVSALRTYHIVWDQATLPCAFFSQRITFDFLIVCLGRQENRGRHSGKWYIFFYSLKFKMAAGGHLGILTFQIIGLKSAVIPHF